MFPTYSLPQPTQYFQLLHQFRTKWIFQTEEHQQETKQKQKANGAGKITKSEHKMENWAYIEGERPEQEEERQRSQDRQRWREHRTCHQCASEASFPPKLCLYYSPLTTFPTHQQPQIWLPNPTQPMSSLLDYFNFPISSSILFY